MKKLVFATALAIGSLGTITAITKALEKDYPGATLTKAYVNGESEYKLEVAKSESETVELYADAEGNWLEM